MKVSQARSAPSEDSSKSNATSPVEDEAQPGLSHLGEVIEADSLRFEAECPRLYCSPALGSFVCVRALERTIFGVVSCISTGAVDAGRRTQALHLPPERLPERMPQLELVLRTCFSAILVGHEQKGEVRPYLPPRPPEIHQFVTACSPAEVEALTREPDYLRVLAAATDAPIEDVLASAILHAAAARGPSGAAGTYVVESGKAIATLFRREPDRFRSVMRRLRAAGPASAGVPWERPLDLA